MWATGQWGHGPWAMRQRLWATGYGSRAMEHGPRVMGHRPRDMGHAGFKDVGTGHAGFEDMTQPRTAGWARLSTCGAQKRPAFGRGGWSAKIQRFLCKRRRPTGHTRLNRLRPRPLHDHETHGGSSGETRAWAGAPGGPHSASRLAARFLLALSPFPVEWANGAHPSQSRGPHVIACGRCHMMRSSGVTSGVSGRLTWRLICGTLSQGVGKMGPLREPGTPGRGYLPATQALLLSPVCACCGTLWGRPDVHSRVPWEPVGVASC